MSDRAKCLAVFALATITIAVILLMRPEHGELQNRAVVAATGGTNGALPGRSLPRAYEADTQGSQTPAARRVVPDRRAIGEGDTSPSVRELHGEAEGPFLGRKAATAARMPDVAPNGAEFQHGHLATVISAHMDYISSVVLLAVRLDEIPDPPVAVQYEAAGFGYCEWTSRATPDGYLLLPVRSDCRSGDTTRQLERVTVWVPDWWNHPAKKILYDGVPPELVQCGATGGKRPAVGHP